MVEGEGLFQSSEPPTVFVVDMKELPDLAIRLLSPYIAQRVLDLILVEVAFERMVKTESFVLVQVAEGEAKVGEHLQNRYR